MTFVTNYVLMADGDAKQTRYYTLVKLLVWFKCSRGYEVSKRTLSNSCLIYCRNIWIDDSSLKLFPRRRLLSRNTSLVPFSLSSFHSEYHLFTISSIGFDRLTMKHHWYLCKTSRGKKNGICNTWNDRYYYHNIHITLQYIVRRMRALLINCLRLSKI